MGFNPFSGVRDAKTSFGGTHLTPGRYKMRIDKCIYMKTQTKGDALIVEMSVIEGNEAHPAGAKRSWYQSAKNAGAFGGACKKFLAAAVGCDLKNDESERVWKAEVEPYCEDVLNQALTAESKIKGREVFVDVQAKPDKADATKSYNQYEFTPAQKYIGG